MKATKSLIEVMFKPLLAFAVLLMAVMFISGKADADALDYLNNNYSGTVTRDDGAAMYTRPGSANPAVKDAEGNDLRLPANTQVLIIGEAYDQDMDMWYQVQVTYQEQFYEGFLYSGRVTRGDAVAFTPTPTPTVEPTPTAGESAELTPGNKFEGNEGNNNSVNKDTQGMVDEANGFKPWKWIIILVIIILVFMIVYTLWVRESERKLEREIERYSNRPQYERLEGELEEDFTEAKALYYDHIGLGDQSNKSLGEVIGNPEDVELDMTGIFDTEPQSTATDSSENYDVEENGGSLKSLIASLEEKLGTGSFHEDDDLGEEADDVQEITDEPENVTPKYAEPECTVKPVYKEPVYRQPVRNVKPEAKFEDDGLSALFDEKEEDHEEAFDLRDKIDNLNEGDIIIHTVYGEGVVEDNSDSQIIQVRFGSEVRFLKKDKLVKKNLIEF